MADEDPFTLVTEWIAAATESESVNPTAAALATAARDGSPTVRMVLVRGIDDRGFVFYTNLGSRKAEQLLENPRAALCLYWRSSLRQLRTEGPVERVSADEADRYFATRPRMAQIGAWASTQSKPMAGRFDLEKRLAKYTARFAVGPVPRPDFWVGFRLRSELIEFWQEKPFRLHERFVFTRSGEGWTKQLLFP